MWRTPAPRLASTSANAEESSWLKRLVVDGFGKYVGRKSERIFVRDDNGTVYQGPPEDLRQVLITGHGAISFDAVEFLAANGVDVIFLDSKGDVTARLSPPEMRTVLTRREQYLAYLDGRSVLLAKEFILAKLRNEYATLGTLAKRRVDTDPDSAEAIYTQREEIQLRITDIQAVDGRNVDEVRGTITGLEGAATSSYWKAIASVVPEDFQFKDRSGRYAPDPVNALLNYGYGILEGEVWRAVHFAGLDPYGGFVHTDRPGKASMVYDLMEEFRQQLIDKSVLKLLTRKEITPQDFTRREQSCELNDKARKTIVTEVLGRFEEYVVVGDEKVRWCDVILNQARNVGKYLRGESTKYEGFWLRW